MNAYLVNSKLTIFDVTASIKTEHINRHS